MLPGFVIDTLLEHTRHSCSIAYLLVDGRGTVTTPGGELSALGLGDIRAGDRAEQHLSFLHELLPLHDELTLNEMEITPGRHVDVHLMPRDDGFVVVLLDKKELSYWRAMAQQKANELELLRQGAQKPALPEDADTDDAGLAGIGAFLSESLDILVLERLSAGHFRRIGTVPGPFQRLYAEAIDHSGGLRPQDRFPFLDNFLEDAGHAWERNDGQIRSGVWMESDDDNREYALEAIATRHAGHRLLLLQISSQAHENERRLLQKGREIALAKERVERADRNKSLFLSHAGHELKTPLNIIMGYAQLIARDTALPQQHLDHLADIKAACRHLAAIIDDLQDLARIEAGQVDLKPAPVSCAGLMRECAKAMTPLLEQHAMKLELDVSRVGKLCCSFYDPGRII